MSSVDRALVAYRNFWCGLLRALVVGDRRPIDASADADAERRADELLEVFRHFRGKEFADDARDVVVLLDDAYHLVDWPALRDILADMIHAAVQDAERFGDGTGTFKRRFVVDVIARVAREYHHGGLPFARPVDDYIVKPMVTVLVYWTVEALNTFGDKVWAKPTKKERLPFLYKGQGMFTRVVIWLALLFWRVYSWVADRLVVLTKYERLIRRTRKRIQPEVDRMLATLPPADLGKIAEHFVEIADEIGEKTRPHVQELVKLIQTSVEIFNLPDEERRRQLVIAFRKLLYEAYPGYRDALGWLLESAVGEYLLDQGIRSIEHVLDKNNLIQEFRLAHQQRLGQRQLPAATGV